MNFSDKEKLQLLNIANSFIEFYIEQNRLGCVDGAYDPAMIIDIAKKLCKKYNFYEDPIHFEEL